MPNGIPFLLLHIYDFAYMIFLYRIESLHNVRLEVVNVLNTD